MTKYNYGHLRNTINWYLDFIDGFTMADYLRSVADEIEDDYAEFIKALESNEAFRALMEELRPGGDA